MSKRSALPGSRWWKFDFHTHTPASNDYGYGDKTLKGIDPVDWLQGAMQAGLDGVVVSDHNSGAWIDRLQEKNRAPRCFTWVGRKWASSF